MLLPDLMRSAPYAPGRLSFDCLKGGLISSPRGPIDDRLALSILRFFVLWTPSTAFLFLPARRVISVPRSLTLFFPFFSEANFPAGFCFLEKGFVLSLFAD